MPPTEENPTRRFGADGEESVPAQPVDDVIVANVPGDDPDKFVTLVLSNPLNQKDREYLGLPSDASTEVGQKVRVNKNGAKQIIGAGYATIDPEDGQAVREALRGGPESPQPVQAAASPVVDQGTSVEPSLGEQVAVADGGNAEPFGEGAAEQGEQAGSTGGKSARGKSAQGS